MRTSLDHVAKKLGVNRSTVSRALRQDPRISGKTRRRVEIACQEMGYRPLALLSELASSHWDNTKITRPTVIAYINSTPPEDTAWTLMIPLMREHAGSLGYQLETFRQKDFLNSSKLQKMLRNRGITELIVGPITDPDQTIELDWEKFIAVQLLPAFYQLPLHSVVTDQFRSVVLAWQKAVSHGYRRIGIILFDHAIKLADDLLRAAAGDACQKYVASDLPALPPFHISSRGERRKDFIKWVKTNEPDVIIGFSEVHYYFYREEFHREPAYICLHRSEGSKFTGIADASQTCAKEGINLLHFCRRTYQWGLPKERIDHVVEPTWNEGSTLPRKGLT